MTNAIVRKDKDLQLITWKDLDLPGALDIALDEMGKVGDLARRAAAITKIESKVDFDKAAEIIVALKNADKRTEEAIKPFTQVLEKMKKKIWAYSNPVYDEVDRLKKVLNPMMATFLELEEKRAQAERDREAREKEARLRREAEEQRQKDEAAAKELRKKRVAEIRADLKAGKITLTQSKKLLNEAGATEEAAQVQAALDEAEARQKATEAAARLQVQPNTSTIAGIVKRKNFKFKIVDPQAVTAAYLSPDPVKMGADVRTCETDEDARAMEKLIGGIEIYVERTF